MCLCLCRHRCMASNPRREIHSNLTFHDLSWPISMESWTHAVRLSPVRDTSNRGGSHHRHLSSVDYGYEFHDLPVTTLPCLGHPPTQSKATGRKTPLGPNFTWIFQIGGLESRESTTAVQPPDDHHPQIPVPQSQSIHPAARCPLPAPKHATKYSGTSLWGLLGLKAKGSMMSMRRPIRPSGDA